MKNIYKLLSISILLTITESLAAQLQFTMINHVTQEFSLTNFGTQLDISDYQLCSEFVYANMNESSVIITEGDLLLSTGETVTAIWESPGGFTNSASDMGLYLPFSSFTNPNNMVCFMQYGAGDQGREDVAVSAGLWVEDTFVIGSGPYIYIGDGTQSGVEFWTNFVEPVFPYVVINEVDSDTPGNDMMEFVELYGDPNGALDGLVVVFLNGLNEQSYQTIDLDGLTLNEDGFFLIGNPGMLTAGATFPDNTLQNGADAVAIYQGSASDWPNGTAATTEGLVDILVYDTDDADDAELLTLLTAGGQINESQGGNSVVLSCSRIPDGGEVLNTTTYIAQGPTPGISNLLPCDGGSLAFGAGGSTFTLCTLDQSSPVDVEFTAANSTGTYIFVVTSETDAFIISASSSPLDFSAYDEGEYHIYGFSYSGTLGAEWVQGTLIQDLTSDECYELSSNLLTLNIETCVVSCEAGSLSLGEGIVGITVCKDDNADEVTFIPAGNDVNAGLNFVLTNLSNQIISFPNQTTDLNELDFGSYRVWSFGFVGTIDATTIEPGDLITSIVADCFDLSSNFITVTVNDCSAEGCDDLYFSEYIEGLASNKVLEIYNPLPFAVDLSQYMVLLYFNGNVAADDTYIPVGVIEPGDVFLIVGPSSSQGLLDQADVIDNIASFNGDDVIELRHNSVLIDVIGELGEDPGTEWLVGTGSTRDHVLVRKADINNGETQWSVGQTEWDVYEPNDFSHVGSHDMVPCGGVSLPYVFFDEAFTTITEEDGDILIGISVLNPVADAVVEVSIFGGDANEGTDYTSTLPTTLTFLEGTTETQFITISMIDDLDEEGVENIIINLSGDDEQVNFLQATHNVVIDNSDTFYPVYTIADVTGTNNLGVADSVGIYCELSGIVHGPNFNNAGVQFTMIDETDGIAVFASLEDFGYTVVEGDEVVVGGLIAQFMGLTQIYPDYIEVVSTGNEIETPLLITELEEDNESHMVRINCVSLVDPLFWTNQGGGFTVQITDGLELYDMRIDSDCDLFGTNPPEGTFNVVGIGSQFDTESPYTSGYQLFPRSIFDIQDQVLADFTMNPDDFIIFGDEGTDVEFTYTGAGAFELDWDFGDGQSSNEVDPTHTYSFNFLNSVSEVTITLIATNANGCTHEANITIDAVYISVDEADMTTIQLYPNPASNHVVFNSNHKLDRVKIYTMNGALISDSGLINQNLWSLDISDWAAGVYLVEADSDAGISKLKLIKQ
jgi:hypothetical protein